MAGRRFVAAAGCAVALTACGSTGQPGTQPSSSTLPTPITSSPAVTPTHVPSATASPHPTIRPTTTRPAPTKTSTPTAPPPVALPAWLRGSPVTRLPTSRRVVALTFDGGSGAQGASTILRTLGSAGIPATFFLTGDFVRSYPATASAIGAHYLVGNHTQTHPHLTQLSSAAVIAEIKGAEQQLKATLGRSPRPWFRFPFGEYDARTLQLVHGLGYGAIGWTVDTRGWQGREAGTAADIVNRVRAALQPGTIVLMHLGANPTDGTTYDADALPQVIAAIRSAGYTFVNLSSW